MRLTKITLVFMVSLLFLCGIPAVGLPGDTSGEAIEINMGTTSGDLEGSDDSRWYFFTAPSAGLYEIQLSGEYGSDFDLYLYDDNENIIDSSEDTSYPEIIQFQASAGDTFYVEVYSYSGSGSFDLLLSQEQVQSGDGYEYDSPEMIDVGSYSRFISLSGSSYFFAFETTKNSSYHLELSADDSTDFDIYIFDSQNDTVSSSTETLYPENLVYSASTKENITIEIRSYTGSGTFEFEIAHFIPLPDSYEQVGDSGYAVYQFDNVAGQEIQLNLDRLGLEYQLAITDTDFDLSILTALILNYDEVYNPHLLFDTYPDYSDTMMNISTSYTHDLDTVYVVVYSIDVMTDLSEYNSGFDLESDKEYTEILPSDEAAEYLPYNYEGSIEENGDQYRDNDEWILLKDITIPAGEIFDFYVVADTYAEIGAILFEGTTASDLNAGIDDVNAWDGVGQISSTTYVAGLGEGYAFFSFKSQTTVTANLAIFSNSQFNYGSQVGILMSHSSSGGVVRGSDSTTAPAPGVMIIAIGLGIFVTIYRQKFQS